MLILDHFDSIECVLLPISIHSLILILNVHSKNHHYKLGSALKNNCRKGQNCNFLHIFKNPSSLFSIERTLRNGSNVINSKRNQTTQNDTKDEYVIKLVLL